MAINKSVKRRKKEKGEREIDLTTPELFPVVSQSDLVTLLIAQYPMHNADGFAVDRVTFMSKASRYSTVPM